MRHVTENGLKLIKRFEWFSPTIYQDAAGFPTIGYGHLIIPSEITHFKNGITEAKADSLLKQDLAIAEKAVARLINVPLNNNQFDALTSFTYNLGTATLKRSTLRAKINRHEHQDARDEFLRWVWVGGRKLPGLVRRRRIEAALYSSQYNC